MLNVKPEPSRSHLQRLVCRAGAALSCPRLICCAPARGRLPSILLCTDGPSSGFKHFWLTDSCPHTARKVMNRAPFEVLSLSNIICSALQI
mmetsp:Transcript_21201/g.58872  ORF Transcript_21201/g.58872 Transcript_21201/m.58872 type:complete len:91 (+) Transcript_21201:1371-1643(+)